MRTIIKDIIFSSIVLLFSLGNIEPNTDNCDCVNDVVTVSGIFKPDQKLCIPKNAMITGQGIASNQLFIYPANAPEEILEK